MIPPMPTSNVQRHSSYYYLVAVLYVFVGLGLLVSSEVWSGHWDPRYAAVLRILYFIGFAALLYAFIQRERAMENSRAQYSLLLESLMEPVVIHQNGVFVSTNLSALQFFEAQTESELLGTPIMNVVDRAYHDIVTERLHHLSHGKSTRLREEKFVTLRGNLRDVEVAGVTIRYNRKSAALVIFRDITERKQAQAALEDSERRLRTLIDALPDHICFLDNEGRWIEANNTLLRSVGLNEAAFRGKTAQELAELCTPDYRNNFLDNSLYSDEIYKRGNHLTYEFTLPDDTWAASEISRVPVTSVGGTSMGWVIIARDVTAQRLAVRHLVESEQRYRSLFMNDRDMVVSVDQSGVITSANPAAELILGYTAEELVGILYGDLVLPHDKPETYALHQAALDGHSRTALIQLRRKDGRCIEVEEKQIPIRENDKVSGFFCIVRDLTPQKEAEELVIRSERLSAVGQMAAGVAHEIRNPLAVLKGFLQLIQSSPERVDFYIDIMKAEFDRIESIVNEFLVFAKPTKRYLESCDCTQLVQEVVNLMTPEANLRNITVSQSFTDGSYDIYCEKNQIKQVLVNILKNAIEAMSQGGDIVICLNPVEDDTISINVRDNGPGIPETRMVHIGEPFYTTKDTGTGLGLTVSRKIIESHHGVLRIRSQVGVGTEVEVVLPRTV